MTTATELRDQLAARVAEDEDFRARFLEGPEGGYLGGDGDCHSRELQRGGARGQLRHLPRRAAPLV